MQWPQRRRNDVIPAPVAAGSALAGDLPAGPGPDPAGRSPARRSIPGETGVAHRQGASRRTKAITGNEEYLFSLPAGMFPYWQAMRLSWPRRGLKAPVKTGVLPGC